MQFLAACQRNFDLGASVLQIHPRRTMVMPSSARCSITRGFPFYAAAGVACVWDRGCSGWPVRRARYVLRPGKPRGRFDVHIRFDDAHLARPDRLDLAALQRQPASNLSSRKYSKPALRLVTTTFTSSAIEFILTRLRTPFSLLTFPSSSFTLHPSSLFLQPSPSTINHQLSTVNPPPT